MNPFIKEKKQVSIFVTAGYPNIDSLSGQIELLQQQGVDFIEVGIPFSDPMADGPVIQETSMVALKNGMKLELLLQQLETIKDKISVPIVLMGYLNPVLQFGLEAFLKRCQGLNVASLILPDMSVELYSARYKNLFEQYSIQPTFLVTPLTPNERVSAIAEVCKNSFVYLVGQNSITGAGYELGDKLDRYKELKALCGTTPLFLGFGIDSVEKKQQGFQTCDGVIVGTAYLKALKVEKHKEFLSELIG